MIDFDKYRIGHSDDIHKLVEGRKLILGGIDIPFEKGLLGHSDADVVYHVVSEAILGALSLGDLGTWFPDNDPKYENMDSSYFVKFACQKMEEYGYRINNMDITIYLEKPILKDYKGLMEFNIANLLNTITEKINVKATRKEGLGYIGEGLAIEAECVVLLVKENN